MSKSTKPASTGHDLVPVRNQATEEQMKAFNMDVSLVNFMFDEPFYSSILRHLSKQETTEIPTAGVIANKTRLAFDLFWNRRFCASLSRDHMRGLLIHEVLHLLYEHTTTRARTPHIIHNYATDLAINSTIRPEMLPEGGLIPGKAFKPLTAAEKKHIGPERVKRYNLISAKIAGFPTHQSSDWYFEKLMEDPEVAEAIQEEAKGNSINPADLRVDGEGNLVDKDGNPVVIVPGSTDDHGGWGNIEDVSQEVQDILKQKVKDALSKAIERADSNNSWGSVSHEMRSELRAMVSKEVPWQQLLKRFTGFARSTTRSTSWTRINRNNPGGQTGNKRGTQARIAIYLDQSGSVGNEDLALLFGELAELSKHIEYTIFPFDTEVGKGIKIKHRRFQLPERNFSGGTSFDAAAAHSNANRAKFDAAIFMTDGECSKPESSMIRRAWIICPNRKLLFEPDDQDTVIQMNKPA